MKDLVLCQKVRLEPGSGVGIWVWSDGFGTGEMGSIGWMGVSGFGSGWWNFLTREESGDGVKLGRLWIWTLAWMWMSWKLNSFWSLTFAVCSSEASMVPWTGWSPFLA